jgi:uncharacterized RDD family membrane protein YckC
LGLFLTLVLIMSLLSNVSKDYAKYVSDWLFNIRHVLGRWFVAVVILLYGVITKGYFILFEYLWSGSTPGKRSVNIRVIRSDGRPITFMDSAVRNIVRLIDILGDLYPLGIAVMFFDSRNRRLGDFAAGTLVIYEKDLTSPVGGKQESDHRVFDPALRRIAASMTAEEYQLVIRFLSRREGLDPEYRTSLAKAVSERILQGSDFVAKSGSDYEVMLDILAMLYRERTRIL